MAADLTAQPDLASTTRFGPVQGPATHGQYRPRLQWLALHSIGIAIGVMFLLPFVFVTLTALMGSDQTLTRNLWPSPFVWHNLVDVWRTPGFLTWWQNTIVYATV